MSGSAGPGDSLVRAAIEALTPYQPGKPIEDVQRELGLDRVVKLASNEGPFPPFPSALAAMAEAAAGLNRYPDGGAYRLHQALADRHGVNLDEVCVGSGADGCLDMLSQALLEAGDEIVCGWPSFPSYVIYTRKQGATPRARAARRRPLRPRRAARRGDRTHQDRLRLPSQQPDRDDEYPCRARRVLRPRAAEPCSSSSTRRTSSTSTTRTTPTPSPSTTSSAATSSCCARSRRSTASRGCASATPSGRRRSSARWRRCGGRSTSRRRHRLPRSRASRTRPRSLVAARSTAKAAPSSCDAGAAGACSVARRRRQLPARRAGRGLDAVLREPAARGRHRPAAARLRRADSGAYLGRDARGARAARSCARPRPRASLNVSRRRDRALRRARARGAPPAGRPTGRGSSRTCRWE